MPHAFFSVAERPELRERRRELGAVWPEFMLHDAISDRYWGRQYGEFPDFQFFLVDTEGDTLLAEGNCVPVPWDPSEPPDEGWDAALADSFAGRPATLVSAIAVTVAPSQQGRGISHLVLAEMRRIAAGSGAAELVAPVRPSRKAGTPSRRSSATQPGGARTAGCSTPG